LRQLKIFNKNNMKKIVKSGTVGIAWRITEDGTLTISGTEKMPSFLINKLDKWSLNSMDDDFLGKYGSKAPWRNDTVRAVVIENGITSVSNGAFEGCHSLTTVVIPKGVTYIGQRAFKDCSSLTTVAIPKSVTDIRENAFEGCSSLTSVAIPKDVEIGSMAFYRCSSLTMVRLPANFSCGAFKDCSSLMSVSLPDDEDEIIIIENNTFSGCRSLTSFTIPENVHFILNHAFKDCISLTEIINHAIVPHEIDNSVFKNVNIDNCTLRVPDEAIDEYCKANVWKDFGKIVAIENMFNN
jgi:hypothetical protein